MMAGATHSATADLAGGGDMPEARSDGFWRALWRHKWMIAASILIGLALGSYYGRRQVPMFASRSILLFEQFSKPGPDGSSVNDPY